MSGRPMAPPVGEPPTGRPGAAGALPLPPAAPVAIGGAGEGAAGTDHLTVLPEDLLQRVLGSLPLADAVRCGMTCRALRTAAFDERGEVWAAHARTTWRHVDLGAYRGSWPAAVRGGNHRSYLGERVIPVPVACLEITHAGEGKQAAFPLELCGAHFQVTVAITPAVPNGMPVAVHLELEHLGAASPPHDLWKAARDGRVAGDGGGGRGGGGAPAGGDDPENEVVPVWCELAFVRKASMRQALAEVEEGWERPEVGALCASALHVFRARAPAVRFEDYASASQLHSPINGFLAGGCATLRVTVMRFEVSEVARVTGGACLRRPLRPGVFLSIPEAPPGGGGGGVEVIASYPCHMAPVAADLGHHPEDLVRLLLARARSADAGVRSAAARALYLHAAAPARNERGQAKWQRELVAAGGVPILLERAAADPPPASYLALAVLQALAGREPEALVRAGAIPRLVQVCRPRRAEPDPAAKALAGAVLGVLTEDDERGAAAVRALLGAGGDGDPPGVATPG